MRRGNSKATLTRPSAGSPEKDSPNNAVLIQNGLAHHQAGRLQEAEAIYQSILQAQPQHPDALHLLGLVAHQAGKFDIAIARYEQALAISPDNAEAHYNLANALKEFGRLEDAITHYESIIRIKPDNAEAHNNLAYVLRELGRYEDAITRYESALAIQPDYAEVHYHLAMIKPGQEQIPIIEKRLTNPSISEKDAMHYHYALGSIYDETKSYTRAINHYFKANTLKRKTITYNSQHNSDFIDRLIQAYSKSYFHEKRVCGSDSELPVFIVGMPRTGTTLVEQIVSSHPQVYGAGELPSIGYIETAIARQFEASSPYPECMSLCSESVASRSAEQYLQELGNHSQVAKCITDKMPYNFLRIGFIKILFPKARIIHCQRNALDTCTSNFLKYFVEGNVFSFDLNELGRFYLDYARLMDHWRSVFSSEIYDVQYEKLVMDQEKESRQLIEYIGLEWDEKCLDFHKNKRAVRTSSNSQVRQPMYKNSINRWKHYEKHIEPLIEILQKHI